MTAEGSNPAGSNPAGSNPAEVSELGDGGSGRRRLEPRPLVPLPRHSDGVPWATRQWPTGRLSADADEALGSMLDDLMDPDGPLRTTYAALVVHRGVILGERYGGEIEHFDRPPDPVGPETELLSWSMAKSVLHSAVGLLVAAGRLELDSPAPVPEWADPADPRHDITIEDLLEMRDGLDFVEDYTDAGRSDVIEMLFGLGQHDVAAYASGRGMRWGRGKCFSYSSGTTNVLAGILARTVGKGSQFEQWLQEALFEPLGATSFRLGFDEAGTFVASSYVHATARDWARFGELQLRGGIWDGRQVLPAGWVDHGRLPRSVDPEDGSLYGAHWWAEDDEFGTFRAAGYEGQAVVISPGLDLVIVRLGKTPAERGDLVKTWWRGVIDLFRTAG